MKCENRWFVLVLVVLLLVSGALVLSATGVLDESEHLPIISLGPGASCAVTPDPGVRTALVADIDMASRSVFVESYLLSDKAVIASLQRARKRGCDVRVIMEEAPYGGFSLNVATRNQLRSAGIDAVWGNRIYSFSHAKFLVIDGTLSWLMTANLTKSAFDTNRDVFLRSHDDRLAAELTGVFRADRNRGPCKPGRLVVSPGNARGILRSLLMEAQTSVDVAVEVFDEPEIEGVLRSLVRKGIRVRVQLATPDRIAVNKDTYDRLALFGAAVCYVEEPYLHTKYIIVDGRLAYVGSHNFTAGSIDENREVGIITADSTVVDALHSVFDTDWSAP